MVPKVGPDSERGGSIERPTDIVRLAVSGDAHATRLLLQQVVRQVVRAVRSIVGPQFPDVDDVVQESLIAFIQALPSFRGECDPAGFACTIALRTALGARRRGRTWRDRYADAADAEALPSTDSPSANSEAQRRMALLRNLLDEIPAEQAEALTMRVVLGWSLDEIARASQAPTNTIRSRLRLAKEALRRKIESNPALAEELRILP